MKFIQVGSRWLCEPYQIVHGVRGYQVWRLSGAGYNILELDIPTFKQATEWADSHAKERAKEVYLS